MFSFRKRGIVNNYRAQITIFIIMGILLVLGIILYFSLKGSFSSSSSKAETIEGYMGDCVERAIKDAIFFNGLQGGYFVSPDDSVAFDVLQIPIYWDNTKAKESVPSIATLEDQLGLGIGISLADCVGDLQQFKDKGYEVKIQEFDSADVTISEKSVSADVVMPIYLTKDGKTTKYQDFSGSVTFDLMKKYRIVQQAIALQKGVPNDIPLSRYGELAYTEGFSYETIEMPGNIIVYSFSFDNDVIPEAKYIYTFAGRYNWR